VDALEAHQDSTRIHPRIAAKNGRQAAYSPIPVLFGTKVVDSRKDSIHILLQRFGHVARREADDETS
jgi:hypothetical protein